MNKEIKIDEIDNIEINFNTINISGYKKGLFGKKLVYIKLGMPGILTNIISKECLLRYPADKFMQSNAQKTIKLGEEMDG